MPLSLRENLSFCVIERHIVFLDLADDRYFSVPEETSAALLAEIDGGRVGTNDGDLKALVQRGFLYEAATGTSLRPAFSAPATHSTIDEAVPDFSVTDMLKALAGLGRSALRLKWRSLRAIVEETRRRKISMQPCQGAYQRGIALAGGLRSLHTALGPNARCLLYSLALTDLLLSERIPPTLVFGVKLAPFSAHCWVQYGDCILNDSLEHSRLFTPILAV